jgi:hypothetical protein
MVHDRTFWILPGMMSEGALHLAAVTVFYVDVAWEERVFNANAGFVRFCARFSGRSVRFGPANVLVSRLLPVLGAGMLGLAQLSCGSSHAILEISAPSSVLAGVPFGATVTAMYNGQRDTMIDGPIHFTTSDKAAQLPTLYVFTAADAGSHTFLGLTLVTPGNQTMTVSDYDATPIAGTVNIMVTAAESDAK